MASRAPPGSSYSSDKVFSDYSSYYRDSFFLRCVVTINGKKTEAKFSNERSNPSLYCKELDRKAEFSESDGFGPLLFDRGVFRLKGFHSDDSQVLLISVDFASTNSIKRFLSTKNALFKLAFRNAFKLDLRPCSKPIDIDSVDVKLFLVLCLGSNELMLTYHVTKENCEECFKKWTEQSKIPQFTSDMFQGEPSHPGTYYR